MCVELLRTTVHAYLFWCVAHIACNELSDIEHLPQLIVINLNEAIVQNLRRL